MSVEQYNADWDKHQSPEGNGIDDPSVINETSRDSHIPNSLTNDLVSIDSDRLNEKDRYALLFAPYNSDSQQRVIAELIDSRRSQLANDISACGNWFAVLECSDCSETNHSPQTCNRPDLCEDCRTNHGGRAQGKYLARVLEWPRHSYLCLKLPYEYNDPSEARKAIRNQLRRFMDRTVSMDSDWLKKIRERDREFAKYLKSEYIDKGLNVPVDELITGYIAGRHSIYQENGKWKVHIDMLANSRFWDRDKLAEVWGFSKREVWSQRVTPNKNGFRTRTAIEKTLAYVTDKIDCDNAEALIDYHDSTKGEHRSIIGGSLHPDSDSSDTETVEERCAHCGSRDLRLIEYSSSIPEGSKETELSANGERISRGNKFANLIPPD